MFTNYPDEMEFYNLNLLLSTNRPISISFSIRNLGKSYSAYQLVLKHALELNRTFCWSRWDEGELSIAIDEFTKLINIEEWNKVSITNTKFGCYFENKETKVRGYFLPVKEASKFKGLDIPNLYWWVYDEFIPEFYLNRVRKLEEADKWNSMYTTLKRNNPNFRAILICNCISWFNAFFKQWKISYFPSGEIRFFKQEVTLKINGKVINVCKDIAMENVKPTLKMIERIIEDEVLKGKTKEDIENYLSNTTNDKTGLIEECPDKKLQLINLQWLLKGKYYSFREYNGICYFVETKLRTGVRIITMNKDEITEGVARDRAYSDRFEKLINASKCRFDNGFTQNAIFSMVWLGRERL